MIFITGNAILLVVRKRRQHPGAMPPEPDRDPETIRRLLVFRTFQEGFMRNFWLSLPLVLVLLLALSTCADFVSGHAVEFQKPVAEALPRRDLS